MGVLDRLFKRQARTQESENEGVMPDVELTFAEFKEQVKKSLNSINQIEDKEFTQEVMTTIQDIKETIEELMSKDLGPEFNTELKTNAEDTRTQISTDLNAIIELRKPETLLSINEFVKKINELIPKSKELINKSIHAQVVFRDETNELQSLLDDLIEQSNELLEGVNDRNTQLESFTKLINDIKTYDESLKNLEKVKEEELSVRKKISNYERDKAFMSSEIARIKEVDVFTELRNAEKIFNSVKQKKNELENLGLEMFTKLAKPLKKEFGEESNQVIELLKNPLDFITRQEGVFNKMMNKIINDINSGKLELSERDKSKYLKILSDDVINDYIIKYKEYIDSENSLKKRDYSLLRKADAFERRLIELTSKVNIDVKQLDSYNNKIESSKREIDALKSKVEVSARECYNENVHLI